MICQECLYFVSERAWDGKCRRHAPSNRLHIHFPGSSTYESISDTIFPLVDNEWFCGDFVKKKEG